MHKDIGSGFTWHIHCNRCKSRYKGGEHCEFTFAEFSLLIRITFLHLEKIGNRQRKLTSASARINRLLPELPPSSTPQPYTTKMSADDGYIVLSCAIGDAASSLIYSSSDPYDNELVRIYDRQLHRTLSDIFRERSCEQLKIFTLIENYHENSLFQEIRRQDPILSKLFKNKQELSPLWIAVLCRFQKSAELLVSSGADVNELCAIQRDSLRGYNTFEELNLLHALIEMYPSTWNEQFIALVIEHGADLTIRDLHGCTALHLAVKFCRVKVTEKLLEKGANTKTICNRNKTPLLEAAENENAEELVPLLMKHGADLNHRDNFGCNVLYYLATAPGGEHLDLAKALIDVGVSLREGTNQPIHVAVQKQKIGLVHLFLDHGANVNAQGFRSDTPLSIAVRDCDNPEMLLILLKRGANIDLKNMDGETAAHNLGKSNKNTVKKIEIFLAVGADMFSGDNRGRTPFYNLMSRMEIKGIQRILKDLALKKSCLQPSAEFKDEMIVKEKYPQYWDFYQRFIKEINEIKSKKFIESCTYIDLLTKCHCQIASLMRNREFEKKFRDFNLSYSLVMSRDVVQSFDIAKNYYLSVLLQEEVISEAVYNRLPYMVVRRMALYAVGCDICEVRKKAQANRSIKR